MSDKNIFDTEVKTKMATYEVEPPEETWNNILKQRSYGHVTANRIIQGFYLMGVIPVIIGLGIYFLSFANAVEAKYSPKATNPVLNNEKLQKIQFAPSMKEETAEKVSNSVNALLTQSASTPQEVPRQDITASINAGSFHINPKLFADQSLQRLLNNTEDISVVKPFELVRYEQLQKIKSKTATSLDLNEQLPKQNSWTYFPTMKKRNSYHLLLTFSPEFINKNFELKNFLPAGYADKRQDYIRSRNAYTFSGRLGLNWGKHSFTEIGLDWTRIFETSTVGSSTHQSNFSFFSVPVLFGQEVQFNRISWEMKAGIAYQFYNEYKGKILGADAIGIVDLNNTHINPYRTSGVFNLHLATGISYQYSESLKLMLEPYYKRSINSLSKKGSSFTEKIEYMGVSVGVKKGL